MKHAFLIQVHRDFEQIKVLADDLVYVSQCDVYLHVDAKEQILHQQLAKHYGNNPRITLIDCRESVYWGGFSQVKATLKLLENAVKHNYDYFSLISGQDYLIRSIQQFNAFLAKNKGAEFIEARQRNNTWRVRLTHNRVNNPKFRKYRYYRYYALLLSLINYRQKQHINQYKIYFGSSWFTLSQNAVNYIIDFISHNPGFVKDFETSTCGDEHFFQTILMNSQFKSKIANDNLRFIKFKLRSNSPEILFTKDLEEMLKSHKFIARKFDWHTQDNVITMLREGQRLPS
jgi:hypothetical protein